MSRLLMAVLAVLLAVALAACGTTAASPTPTPTPTPEETPDDGETPTDEPIGDAALEDLLPDEVGGITLEYESMTGADMVAANEVTPELEEFLQRVGADLDDISVAIGFGFNAEDPTTGFISIVAFRVAGANPDQLVAEMEAAMEAEAENPQISEGSLGGKDVKIIATGDGPEQQRSYVYARNDIVFMVNAANDELSEEALSLLP